MIQSCPLSQEQTELVFEVFVLLLPTRLFIQKQSISMLELEYVGGRFRTVKLYIVQTMHFFPILPHALYYQVLDTANKIFCHICSTLWMGPFCLGKKVLFEIFDTEFWKSMALVLITNKFYRSLTTLVTNVAKVYST